MKAKNRNPALFLEMALKTAMWLKLCNFSLGVKGVWFAPAP